MRVYLVLGLFATGLFANCSSMKTAKINQEDATLIASNVAEKKIDNLKDFELSIEETDNYWIFYYQNLDIPEDGARQHFSVWVNKADGKSLFFLGR